MCSLFSVYGMWYINTAMDTCGLYVSVSDMSVCITVCTDPLQEKSKTAILQSVGIREQDVLLLQRTIIQL